MSVCAVWVLYAQEVVYMIYNSLTEPGLLRRHARSIDYNVSCMQQYTCSPYVRGVAPTAASTAWACFVRKCSSTVAWACVVHQKICRPQTHMGAYCPLPSPEGCRAGGGAGVLGQPGQFCMSASSTCQHRSSSLFSFNTCTLLPAFPYSIALVAVAQPGAPALMRHQPEDKKL
jgi:hypothetical protein